MKAIPVLILISAALPAQTIPGRYVGELAREPAGQVQAALLRSGKVARGSREVAARQQDIARSQFAMRAAVAKHGARGIGSVDFVANGLGLCHP